MNVAQRRLRFRELLAGDRLVFPTIVFDALSAWMAEDLGYEVGFMAGPTTSAAVLGAPNHYICLMTATELAEQVRRVCRSCAIPVIVVAENGFGNALNVMRTVAELESAGASAITLDDPVLPFRFGGERAEYGFETWEHSWDITPLEESVGKLKAALAARQDPKLVIVARTRALGIPGDQSIAEVTRRLKAYERAGADAVMVGDIHTRAELEAVGAATKLPLIVNSASSLRLADENRSDDEILFASGVRCRVLPPVAFWNSVNAMYETMKAMRHGRDGQIPPDVARVSVELKAKFLRHAKYLEWTKAFMS